MQSVAPVGIRSAAEQPVVVGVVGFGWVPGRPGLSLPGDPVRLEGPYARFDRTRASEYNVSLRKVRTRTLVMLHRMVYPECANNFSGTSP